MREEFLDVLQAIRDRMKQPIIVSSGYRSPDHPLESQKPAPGEHTYGLASDVLCHGQYALKLLEVALSFGISRIGLHQKGPVASRFMHLGIADQYFNQFPQAIWTY